MNWVNNQIELRARNIKTPDDAMGWFNKSKLDLHELIKKHEIPTGLTEMTPSSAIEHLFSPEWEWAEFKTKTFWGAKFEDVEAAKNPYSNWTELIGLTANSVASSRHVLSAL